jgi:hypothetical protein
VAGWISVSIIPGAIATFVRRHQERVPAGTVDEMPQTPVLVGGGLEFWVEGSEPVTLWPSRNAGPRRAGRHAWVTHGDGRTRQFPANVAKNAMPLMMLLLPGHYHARSVTHDASHRYVRGAFGLLITR